MASKHEKMYANSPTLEKGEDGKPYVKKNKPTEAEKKTAEVDSGTAGMQMHDATHALERGMMHHRHEMEHTAQDMKGGDKKEMHARHIKEIADMHKRHEKGGKIIEKVEDNKKE